jgi:hypothetical protein
VLRSARPEDIEDVDEGVLVGFDVGSGWVVRAREERRGDIETIGMAQVMVAFS